MGADILDHCINRVIGAGSIVQTDPENRDQQFDQTPAHNFPVPDASVGKFVQHPVQKGFYENMGGEGQGLMNVPAETVFIEITQQKTAGNVGKITAVVQHLVKKLRREHAVVNHKRLRRGKLMRDIVIDNGERTRFHIEQIAAYLVSSAPFGHQIDLNEVMGMV